MKNYCETYFLISGNFNPADATKALRLQPDAVWRAGDDAADDRKYRFDGWKFGLQTKYDDCVEVMMMETLSDLLWKVDVLNRFAEEQDVRYLLRVRAHVHPGEAAPDLSPCKDVMLFCCRTDADLDIRIDVHPD